MIVRRDVAWASFAVLCLYAIRHPEAAAQTARVIGHWLLTAADGLASLASHL